MPVVQTDIIESDYGCVLIYVSGAAVCTGTAVSAEIARHRSHVAEIVGNYAVSIPAAIKCAGLRLVRDRIALSGDGQCLLLVIVGTMLFSPLADAGL